MQQAADPVASGCSQLHGCCCPLRTCPVAEMWRLMDQDRGPLGARAPRCVRMAHPGLRTLGVERCAVTSGLPSCALACPWHVGLPKAGPHRCGIRGGHRQACAALAARQAIALSK
eukprot:415458-Alexandrium_andersonii.AAC.1